MMFARFVFKDNPFKLTQPLWLFKAKYNRQKEIANMRLYTDYIARYQSHHHQANKNFLKLYYKCVCW